MRAVFVGRATLSSLNILSFLEIRSRIDRDILEAPKHRFDGIIIITRSCLA